jgi:hypothetical protein
VGESEHEGQPGIECKQKESMHMSAKESPSPSTLDQWKKRVQSYGLDPEIDAVNYRILRTTHSLDEYTRWFNAPQHANGKRCDLDAEKVAALPDALMRRHVVRHITGECVIHDAELKKAFEQRVKTFYAWVMAAPDIVITAQNPLIINSPNTITIYNNVTLKDGGYIKISVPCSFQCETFTKIPGGSSAGAPAYDISVLGNDGKIGDSGANPTQPKQANSGSNAECDCCGGIVAHDATPGEPGYPGPSGGDASTPGKTAENSPDALFTVFTDLKNFISFVNVGGNGGAGGNGGTGAQGGQGGNGGNGTTCGAYHPDGANGGKGGKGGNGGNASNGGNGGNGGNLNIKVPQSQTTNVSVTLAISSGGNKGARGFKGLGGPGGKGGSSGGSSGPQGDSGDSDGLDGQSGQPGSKGSATINGVPVQ